MINQTPGDSQAIQALYPRETASVKMVSAIALQGEEFAAQDMDKESQKEEDQN